MLEIKKNDEIVALAGLLHDIGKLLNRCDGFMEGRRLPNKKHQQLSVDFINLLENTNILKHNGLLRLLVQKHHEYLNMLDSFKVQSIEDDYKRALAYIISRADNYSSSERRQEETSESYFKTRPLDSLFNELEITKNYQKGDREKYKLKSFSHNNIFPNNFDKNTQAELYNLINEFIHELGKLSIENFNDFFNSLYYILEKYTWCLPSDTKKKVCDISLFDHLKTTSAISLASYLYHKKTDTIFEKAVKDDELNKFLILSVDIEGLNDYITNVNTTKQASKRLRGKSFLSNLLIQSIAFRIVKELDLTIANILIYSSDKAYILADNTDHTKGKIKDIVNEINFYLFNQFEALLYLNVAFVETNGNNLKNFSFILERLEYKSKISNMKKFEEFIIENPILYKNKKIKKVCPVCENYFIFDSENKCSLCDIETSIGSWLVKSKYIAFYDKDIDYDQKIKIFDINSFFIAFIRDEITLNKIKSKPFMVFNLQNTEILKNYPWGFKFYANYVPLYDDYEEFIKFSGESYKINYKEEIKTFEAIGNRSIGAKNLGVLKLEVDNIKELFDVGLLGNREINSLPYFDQDNECLVDYTSISRITTLWRMLNSFFESYIYNLFKLSKPQKITLFKEKVDIDLSNHYIVSSNGTNLTIIGPWNEVIFLSKFINDKFKEFVSHNTDMTLSAGISIIRNKEPIMYGLKNAEESLNKAKLYKNGLVIFDRFIYWKDFNRVFDLAEFIYKKLKAGVYSQNFIYRLLEYTQMVENYVDSDYQAVEKLMFVSKFNYDIHRNLVPRIAEKLGIKDYKNQRELNRILKEEEIARLKEHFDNEELGSIPDESDFVYKFMRVVLNYAVRKNRGGK